MHEFNKEAPEISNNAASLTHGCLSVLIGWGLILGFLLACMWLGIWAAGGGQ